MSRVYALGLLSSALVAGLSSSGCGVVGRVFVDAGDEELDSGPDADARADSDLWPADGDRPAEEADVELEHPPVIESCGERELAGQRVTFCRVPAGGFMMGSPPEEVGRGATETLHPVILSRSFEIGATEIPRRLWLALFEADPSTYVGSPEAPVQGVNFYEALMLCNSLSEAAGFDTCYGLTGCDREAGLHPSCEAVELRGGSSTTDCEGYRLPTEAEWEYAARAGTTTSTYLGDITEGSDDPESSPLGEIACFWATTPCDVGTREPNGWGLKDMLGNTYEWVWDGFAQYPGGLSIDPEGVTSAARRVTRGGGYTSLDWYSARLRAAFRVSYQPQAWNPDRGVRVARTLPPGG